MKKGIALIILVVAVAAGFFYQKEYTGKEYYTQIITDGHKFIQKDDQDRESINYSYNQKFYNEDGELQKLSFNGGFDRPLKKNAYLKAKVHPKKGVLSWEEVSKSEVPKKALEEIEKNQ
ncbi:DUF1093 domain-containing protein [Carnobacterium divergens]|uniref:YxeA family protein n=2 Tax=Carnobacterium divergens TaxID=2748 RepID=A0A0R2I6H8_CARDV|nr:YxeA family protein [Carnobacterium divergens]ANZ99469.1 hypothetical protein BFC22_04825 [Carnobacterium divergens]KRN57412.1 hypothetical protein IV74_GL000395 [Carnobacterium divergens DSM 20623]MDO0875264.1 YxeA family protein [Carnobacterium divergens]MDT1958244.1 YxeA family protein [Carnobacterium divergens]MDT1973511.1 YxeA family protein [Carnobacterium divergens]